MTCLTATVTASSSIGPLLVDRLNDEWNTVAGELVPSRWSMIRPLEGCDTLGGVLDRLVALSRGTQQRDLADEALLGLLTAHIDQDDYLAGRVVLQSMLGRAVTLARRAYRPGHAVRGDFSGLMDTAVVAIWEVIAAYPIHRRGAHKVGVNLAMDALGCFSRLLDDHVYGVEIADPQPDRRRRYSADSGGGCDEDAGIELLGVLVWGVGSHVIKPAEASLLMQVYCPSPGKRGGAVVADELGLSWPTVRARCSRAVRRLASAVRSSNDTALCL